MCSQLYILCHIVIVGLSLSELHASKLASVPSCGSFFCLQEVSFFFLQASTAGYEAVAPSHTAFHSHRKKLFPYLQRKGLGMRLIRLPCL